METIHLIGQFNKPPKRNHVDERAPPPPWAGLRSGCLPYGT
jgi:hypothetical protein